MQLGVEHVDILRAGVADMFGKQDRDNREAFASKFCQDIRLTGCESTSTSLRRPALGRIADKRLAIEVAALRQSLWRWPGNILGTDFLEDGRPPKEKAADVVRWIDTDIMICDPLTKAMSSEKLYAALDTNCWDLKQQLEAIYEGGCEEVLEQANTDIETEMIEAHAKAAPRVYVETDARELVQNTDFSRGKLRPRAKEMIRPSTARESSG